MENRVQKQRRGMKQRKTKVQRQSVRDGVERSTHSRHGTAETKTHYDVDAMSDAGLQRLTDNLPGVLADVQRVVAAASQLLHERGMPSASWLAYDPRDFAIIATGAAARDFHVSDHLSFATLTKYLAFQGFGELDDEMLAARLVVYGQRVLDESLSVELRLTAMRDFTVAHLRLSRFLAGDQAQSARAAKPRRADWTGALKNLAARMAAKHPDASARFTFDRLEAATAEADFELRRDGQKFLGLDPVTGEERTISFSTWQKYLRAARK